MACIVWNFNVNYYERFTKELYNLKSNINNSVKDTAGIITSVLPIALSMAVCMGMGAVAGAVFSCIAALAGFTLEEKKQMPFYVSFLIVAYIFREFNAATASLSIIICGVLLLISVLFYEKTKALLNSAKDNSAFAAIMLSISLIVTILFTTDYFGIGATGNTPSEIIKSYISLGFHPNWRGVLYGTIVMVIMITFPRKFKKASKIISAAFLALIITTALNYLLNPSDMITAIREIGSFSFSEYKFNILIPLFNSKPHILAASYYALSLYLTSLYMILQNDDCKKTDFILSGVANCISGFGTCMPIPNRIKKNNFRNRIYASIIIAIIFFVFHHFIERIPVHSCAVVLIVGVWQSIRWKKIKNAFSSAINIFIFAFIIIFAFARGFEFAIPYSLVAILFKNNINRKPAV